MFAAGQIVKYQHFGGGYVYVQRPRIGPDGRYWGVGLYRGLPGVHGLSFVESEVKLATYREAGASEFLLTASAKLVWNDRGTEAYEMQSISRSTIYEDFLHELPHIAAVWIADLWARAKASDVKVLWQKIEIATVEKRVVTERRLNKRT